MIATGGTVERGTGERELRTQKLPARGRAMLTSAVLALARYSPHPVSPFPVPCSLLSAQQPLSPPPHFVKLAHTYSIVACDSVTGDLGVAVQSKFPNVGRHRAVGGKAASARSPPRASATPPTASRASS